MDGAALGFLAKSKASKLHGQEQQRSAAAETHKHTPHSILARCTFATHDGDTALLISVHTSYSMPYFTSLHMGKVQRESLAAHLDRGGLAASVRPCDDHAARFGPHAHVDRHRRLRLCLLFTFSLGPSRRLLHICPCTC